MKCEQAKPTFHFISWHIS